MVNLEEWADKQSSFVKLESGESFTGKFLGCREGSFKGQPLIEYKFNINGDEKVFSSGATKLARQMNRVEIGEEVSIKKIGEGYDTTYEVSQSKQEQIQTPHQPEGQGWDE